MTADNEGLLSRWSRRKLQSREVNEQEDEQLKQGQEQSLDEPENLDAENQPAAEEESEPVLTDADMPDIDTLHEDSDFTPFMSPGVSDRLRNLALNKMFHAPVFNIRDGLDEYDEDYTSFEALGDIVTCDMKHQLELEAKKKLEAEMEAESVQAEGVNAPESDKDEANSLNTAETDITQTDITETDITESPQQPQQPQQLNQQQHSTATSQSANSKNTAENK
jgi:hypothetical protein